MAPSNDRVKRYESQDSWTNFKLGFIIFYSVCDDLERPMGFECLAHLQISYRHIRKMNDALRVLGTHRHFRIVNQWVDIGDDILGEN